MVAPGVYQEACPIQIQKRDVAIVGTSLRQCVVHPTAATETSTMFEVNSGTYLKNLTFTGMKASGTRGATGSLWEDSTYGLPPTQGWNVAFYNNVYLQVSVHPKLHQLLILKSTTLTLISIVVLQIKDVLVTLILLRLVVVCWLTVLCRMKIHRCVLLFATAIPILV